MTPTPHDRFIAGVLLWGAVLATAGNALHPFFAPGASLEEFLTTVGGSSIWAGLHLVIAIAIVLLTAGVVMAIRRFVGTPGEALARGASVMIVIGGTIFTMQIAALDGAVMPVLAEQLAAASDPAVVLALAEALEALDIALISLVVTLYFGAGFIALGLAAQRVGAFSSWIRGAAMATGAGGIIVGPLMFLRIADGVTFFAFRGVALLATIVAFGLAYELGRKPAVERTPAPAAA